MAVLFIALVAVNALTDQPGLPAVIAVSSSATAVIAALEMCKPSYHGIGWRRINPGLEAWWEAARRAAKSCQD